MDGFVPLSAGMSYIYKLGALQKNKSMNRMPHVSFVAFGDWGKRSVIQDRIADLLSRLPRPDGVLALGDNFYEMGVSSVDDPLWEAVFMNMYNRIGIPWYPVFGNHDYHLNPQAQIDFSKKFPGWCFSNRFYDHCFYWGPSFDESVHLIALDTVTLARETSRKNMAPYHVTLPSIEDDQLQWLESTLQKSRSRYKIVIGHYPVFSAGRIHGDTPELKEKLVPLFERYHVDAYLSGHDHCLDYQRIGCTTYIVSGTGSMISGTNNPTLSGKTGVCYLTATTLFLHIQIVGVGDVPTITTPDVLLDVRIYPHA